MSIKAGDSEQISTEKIDNKESVVGSFEVGWASRYISEGVDVWPGSGMYYGVLDATYKGFIFNAWKGIGDQSAGDRECKILLGYQFSLSETISLTPSWEYATSFPDHGNTPSIEIAWEFAPDWALIASYQWAWTREKIRGFTTIGMEYSTNLTDKINVGASVSYSYNEGFLCAGDLSESPTIDVYGSNNLDYSLFSSYEFAPNWSFISSLNYTQALSVLNRSGMGNRFWASVGVNFAF